MTSEERIGQGKGEGESERGERRAVVVMRNREGGQGREREYR